MVLEPQQWYPFGRTVIGTICTVLASVYLGFMFTQQRMWHRKLWYRFMVITMYFNAGLIPMYMTMKTLHLTNSFWVYIIPAIVQPFNIIMAKTYVESIPPALQGGGRDRWSRNHDRIRKKSFFQPVNRLWQPSPSDPQ